MALRANLNMLQFLNTGLRPASFQTWDYEILHAYSKSNEIQIFRTSQGNENSLENPVVREIRGKITTERKETAFG